MELASVTSEVRAHRTTGTRTRLTARSCGTTTAWRPFASPYVTKVVIRAGWVFPFTT